MRKMAVRVLVLLIAVSLCGCGTASSSNDGELQERIEQLEKENEDLKNQLADLQNGSNPITDNVKKDDEKTVAPGEEASKTITLNNSFDVGEIMTVTLNSSEWCDELFPSNTEGQFTYYQDVEGEKFFVVRGELKNLASEAARGSSIGEATVLVNGKYKIPATIDLEQKDGTNFFGEAKPLQTLPLVIYCSISDELYDNYEEIDLTLNLATDDSRFEYAYYEEIPHDTFVISFKKDA